MPQALVCSANHEYRGSCSVGCTNCDFLISERRAAGPGGRVEWLQSERRALTNLLPMPALEHAGGASAVETGTERQAAGILLALLIAFNVIDCLMTARALSLGYLEGNPVMASLLEIDLPLAMFIKTMAVGAGGYFLWRNRRMAIAYRGLSGLTLLYGMLVAYHLAFQLPA